MYQLTEFSGATWVISARTPGELQRMVGKLFECGHSHNFCVAVDGLRLYVSNTAASCITGLAISV
jgi:hypothetical protein